MPHGDLAQLAAVIGGLGAAAMLLSRTRAQLLAGVAVAVAGETTLAAALIPAADLKLLVSPASHAAALVVGVLLVGAGAAALARYPAIVPVVLLAAAPFRISVSIGAQKAYLLLPLYAVLAAAVLALLARADRLLGGHGAHRLSLGGAPLLLFAIELRRAVRRRRGGVVRARRPKDASRAADRRRSLRPRGSGLRRRHRGGRLCAPGHERPDAPRKSRVGRLHQSSARGCRDR